MHSQIKRKAYQNYFFSHYHYTHMESHALNHHHHPHSFYHLNKAMLILFPLSIFFSFFFIYHPSLLPPLFLHSDHFFSNFPFKLFSCTAERNFIFLVCNGILLLIIRTSGLVRKIKPVKNLDEAKVARVVMKVKVLNEKASDDRVEIIDPGLDIYTRSPSNQEAREEEDDDDIDDGELSRDELNKKCEDFIKRVKQEIQG